MATTLVTLTGDVSDAIGSDFDPRRTKAYVRHNTAKIVTDSGHPMHLGGGSVNVGSDGTFTLPNVVASTSLVSNLQATVYVDYADPATRQRATATFGPYDLSAETGTVDIRTLETVQALDPSFASTTMAAMEQLLTDMQEISGLTGEDAVVAALVAGTGGAGPLTRGALSATYAAQMDVTGKTAAQINTWLQTPTALGLVKRMVGEATIDTPLVILSGTYLDAHGATIKIADGVACNHLHNPATLTVQRNLTGCAITAGDTTLTKSSGADFTSADVGRSVYVAGAGPGTATLCARVASVTNATTVELTIPALHTVAAATAKVYERDRNITVVGGTWDRAGGAHANDLTAHLLNFTRIDGLTVRDVTLKATTGKFGVTPCDATNVTIDNVFCELLSDQGNAGVQIMGPCDKVDVSRVYGTTYDDLVAVTPRNYPSFEDAGGDITNVTINGIYPDNAMCAFKIAGGDGTKARDIKVRNILGTTYQAAVRIWDDTFSPGATDVDGLDISGVAVHTPDDGSGLHQAVIEITASQCGTIRLSDITWPWEGERVLGVHLFSNGAGSTAHVDRLIVDGLNLPNPANDARPLVIKGEVDTLLVRNARVTGATAASNFLLLDVTSSTGTVDLADVEFHAGAGTSLVNVYKSPSDLLRIQSTDVLGGAWVVLTEDGAGALKTVLRGVRASCYGFVAAFVPADVMIDNLTALTGVDRFVSAYGAGATPVALQAVNHKSAIQALARDGVQALYCRGQDAWVDLTILAQRMGDTAYNYNAGGTGIDVGPCVSNGANWKHVYTGATY